MTLPEMHNNPPRSSASPELRRAINLYRDNLFGCRSLLIDMDYSALERRIVERLNEREEYKPKLIGLKTWTGLTHLPSVATKVVDGGLS